MRVTSCCWFGNQSWYGRLLSLSSEDVLGKCSPQGAISQIESFTQNHIYQLSPCGEHFPSTSSEDKLRSLPYQDWFPNQQQLVTLKHLKSI